jgi:hypothetical protein
MERLCADKLPPALAFSEFLQERKPLAAKAVDGWLEQ